MFYRITIDLCFEHFDLMEDIRDKTLDRISDAIILNPHQLNEERGFMKIEECRHDQAPNEPCTLIQLVEVPYQS